MPMSPDGWLMFTRMLNRMLIEAVPMNARFIKADWLYVGTPDYYNPEHFWISFIGSLCFAMLLAALFYFWNRTLKTQVSMKTRELTLQEEALRQSEEKYRCLVENANESIVVAQHGRLVFVNPSAIDLTGYPRELLMSKPFLEFIHPDDKQMVYERHRKRLKGDFLQPRYEFRIVRSDGGIKWVEIGAVLIDWEGGAATLNFIKDVTESKLIREALRQSEKKYRMLIENTHDIIYTLDRQGVFTYVSPSWTSWLGHDVSQVEGKNFNVFVHPEDVEKCERFLDQVVELEEPREGVEYRVLHVDGSYRWHTSNGTPVFNGKKCFASYIGVARDITERKRAQKEREKLESQLNQARKMESVGRLAGGVAHDFNNMLAVIIGHAELLLEQVESGSPVHESLEEILSAARRSAGLTNQLLAFARRQTVVPRVLDLNATVESMLKMIRRLIGENIDLLWSPEGGLWPVRIDPVQIDQLLVNLCVNCRDAVSGTGTVSIKTHNVNCDGLSCSGSHEDTFSGEYVVLEVSDNGCGMDKEVMENLFEPFFTTKEVGKGTGLGLATVYGIVRQNNGFINVSSKPGEGSTFAVYLPRCKGVCQIGHSVKTPDLMTILN